MNLTREDLHAIRQIVEDVIAPLEGRLEALENDIKEIYAMISDLQKNSWSDKDFGKLSVENKILQLHSQLKIAAKQAGVILPN